MHTLQWNFRVFMHLKSITRITCIFNCDNFNMYQLKETDSNIILKWKRNLWYKTSSKVFWHDSFEKEKKLQTCQAWFCRWFIVKRMIDCINSELDSTSQVVVLHMNQFNVFLLLYHVERTFLNHFMSHWSGTWKMPQSKFSASAGLAETYNWYINYNLVPCMH